MEANVYYSLCARALMDYDQAYYKWLYGPEKDKKYNKMVLDKMRSIWFNI